MPAGMTSMRVLIATAEQAVYRGKASMLIVPSVEGELAVLPGHAPLLALLRPGEVRIDCPAGDAGMCHTVDIVVLGGFLEVQPDAVIILADAIARAEDIDAAQAAKAVEQAKQLLKSPDKEIAVQAMLDLELAMAKLQVARKNSKRPLRPSF